MREKNKKKSQLQKSKNSIFGSIKTEYFILLAIFLLSIFIRVQVDPNIPFHYDPGKNIVYARAAVQWFPLIPQYNQYFNLGEYFEYQVFFPYLTALIYKISGLSLVIIVKWLVIISGAALSLTVYFLCFEIFKDKTAALISAFLTAVSNIQILGYMNYYPQIMAMTLMPLSFVFLIRYIKYSEFKYLFFVAVISSLIIITSYLTAFVYFLVLLLSSGIWGIYEKKSFKMLFFIVIITTSLLTFFWLPIIWRHGLTNFIQTALSMILSSTSGLTNQTWTLTTFITLSLGATIITIIGALVILFIKKIKIKWDYPRLLLIVLLIVPSILIGSFLFKPILWVDRYFQFLDIALVLVAGYILSLGIQFLNRMKPNEFKYKGFFLLVLLIIPLWGATHMGVAFGKWGYPSDMAMVDYMQTLPPDSLVAAPPSLHGFWVSALSGVNILGGESAQMIDIHYLGDRESSLIINSPDVNLKMKIIRKYGVKYIFIPLHTPVYMVWKPQLEREGIEAFDNSTYFEVDKVFEDEYGETILIKVRENLTSQFNVKKIDWGITSVGYFVSIISFLLCLYISVIKSKSDLAKKATKY
jgi:hypothetical protein